MEEQRTFRMEAPGGDMPPEATRDTGPARPGLYRPMPDRALRKPQNDPADPNSSTVTCYDCVYALWDRNQWLRTLSTGWPVRPTCANHPDSPGVMQEIPRTGPCGNFRWKKETRGRATPPKPSSPDIAYIPLTKGKFAIVDKADYERLNKYKWFVMDGRDGQFYAGRKEGYRIIPMHREIMQPPPGMVIHHINHNGLDNRRCNLQICRAEENQRYRKLGVTASGFVGVYPCGKKWRAMVQSKGQVLYQAIFADKIEAAKARDDKAAEFFGESARVNFPNGKPQTPPAPTPDQPDPKPSPANQANSAKEGP
jgi:hypothetical protein